MRNICVSFLLPIKFPFFHFESLMKESRCIFRWRRALIVAAYEKDDQSFFDVYFTDVGQLSTDFTTKDLLPIPTHLVNRLPCQAIALRLSHIRPKDSEKTNVRWSSDVTNKLLTYTINEEDDSIQMDVVVR